MQVTVEYNQDSFDYFFSPVFVEFPDLKQTLVDDFIIYKSTERCPAILAETPLIIDLLILKMQALCTFI